MHGAIEISLISPFRVKLVVKVKNSGYTAAAHVNCTFTFEKFPNIFHDLHKDCRGRIDINSSSVQR